MPKVGRTLAAVAVMVASTLASAEGVNWLQRGTAGTLVAGGRSTDGTTLFVCRAAAPDGTVVVGKLAMSGDRAGECQVPLDGREQALTEFDLLGETPSAEGVYKWVPGHATSYPQRAVLAAQTAEGERWVVCAGLNMADGSVHPGYIHDDNCVYGHGGTQRIAENYLVLASSDPASPTAEDAQPATEGFDPNAILSASGIASFCSLAEARCARALPEPAAGAAVVAN